MNGYCSISEKSAGFAPSCLHQLLLFALRVSTRRQVLSIENIFKAFEPRHAENDTHKDRSIGATLIDAGKLTLEGAERILRLQKAEGIRFGEAAVKLGLVSEADIQQVLSRQFDYLVVLAC